MTTAFSFSAVPGGRKRACPWLSSGRGRGSQPAWTGPLPLAGGVSGLWVAGGPVPWSGGWAQIPA